MWYVVLSTLKQIPSLETEWKGYTFGIEKMFLDVEIATS